MAKKISIIQTKHETNTPTSFVSKLYNIIIYMYLQNILAIIKQHSQHIQVHLKQ